MKKLALLMLLGMVAFSLPSFAEDASMDSSTATASSQIEANGDQMAPPADEATMKNADMDQNAAPAEQAQDQNNGEKSGDNY